MLTRGWPCMNECNKCRVNGYLVKGLRCIMLGGGRPEASGFEVWRHGEACLLKVDLNMAATSRHVASSAAAQEGTGCSSAWSSHMENGMKTDN